MGMGELYIGLKIALIFPDRVTIDADGRQALQFEC
jgi:hypothetical protein